MSRWIGTVTALAALVFFLLPVGGFFSYCPTDGCCEEEEQDGGCESNCPVPCLTCLSTPVLAVPVAVPSAVNPVLRILPPGEARPHPPDPAEILHVPKTTLS